MTHKILHPQLHLVCYFFENLANSQIGHGYLWLLYFYPILNGSSYTIDLRLIDLSILQILDGAYPCYTQMKQMILRCNHSLIA